MDKLVTVIVPAWNAEKYLEASLRSVLNQSHRALRLLVIDDGSSDSTPEILARRIPGWSFGASKTAAPPPPGTGRLPPCRRGRTM